MAHWQKSLPNHSCMLFYLHIILKVHMAWNFCHVYEPHANWEITCIQDKSNHVHGYNCEIKLHARIIESIPTLKEGWGHPIRVSKIHDGACQVMDVANLGHEDEIPSSLPQCDDYFSHSCQKSKNVQNMSKTHTRRDLSRLFGMDACIDIIGEWASELQIIFESNAYLRPNFWLNADFQISKSIFTPCNFLQCFFDSVPARQK